MNKVLLFPSAAAARCMARKAVLIRKEESNLRMAMMQHAAQGHKSFMLEAPHPNAQLFLSRMIEGDEMTLEVTDEMSYRLSWLDSANHFGGTLNIVSEASNILRIRQAIEKSIWAGGKTVEVETGMLYPATIQSLKDCGYHFHEVQSNRLVFDFRKE